LKSAPADVIKPSITHRGLLLVRLPTPRISLLASLPAGPVLRTLTPVAKPWIDGAVVAEPVLAISRVSTSDTAPGRSFFRTGPYPITATRSASGSDSASTT